MKFIGRPWLDAHSFGTLLFDVENDPAQEHPLKDPKIEARMIRHMLRLMRENDAPREEYSRMGLEAGDA